MRMHTSMRFIIVVSFVSGAHLALRSSALPRCRRCKVEHGATRAYRASASSPGPNGTVADSPDEAKAAFRAAWGAAE